jgi:hypothetical protein
VNSDGPEGQVVSAVLFYLFYTIHHRTLGSTHKNAHFTTLQRFYIDNHSCIVVNIRQSTVQLL